MIDVNFAALNDATTNTFMSITDLFSTDPEAIRSKIHEIEFEIDYLHTINLRYASIIKEIRSIGEMKERYAAHHQVSIPIFECLERSSPDDIKKITKNMTEIERTLKMLNELKGEYERALNSICMIRR